MLSQEHFRQEALDILRTVDLKTFNEIRDKYIDEVPRRFYQYLDPHVQMRFALTEYDRLGELYDKISVLDLGTAQGYFPYVCQYYGHTAIGIDAEDNEAYRRIGELLKIDRRILKIEPLTPLPDFGMKFDIVTAFGVTFSQFWDAEEWGFLLDDIYKNQLKEKGKILVSLNYTFRNEKIMAEFRKRNVVMDGNQLYLQKPCSKT